MPGLPSPSIGRYAVAGPAVERCECCGSGVGAGSVAPSVEDKRELIFSGRRDTPSVEDRGVDGSGKSG